MTEEGDKTAAKLLKLTDAPAGFLSTIQIGITLAGFLGSAFAADNFAGRLVNLLYYNWGWNGIPIDILNTICVILITLILSYFTLVFGELVPKRIAMQKPYEVARFTSGVVLAISVVMKPVIWFLSASTNLILRIFRLKTQAEEDSVTEDEIKMMVDLGEETGTVEETESKWIQNVFEFNDKSVREIMTPACDTIFIKENAKPLEIEEIVRLNNYSRYPVCKTNLNDVIGILNIKDFFIKKDKSLKEIIRPAYFVPETTLADDLFHNMQKSKTPMAIVVDEYGVPSGIVTTEDLLEEIVGNITDEYDFDEKPELIELEHNLYQVSGNLAVSALNEALGTKIPESEAYDTVGGLIFSMLNSIPKDGARVTVNLDNLELTATKIKNRRIYEGIIRIKEDENIVSEIKD